MSRLLAPSPLQGASSQDPCQRPAAPAPCTPACDPQAAPGPAATEGRQSGPCRGSASPEWSPSTLGPPKAQSPSPAGRLYAEHLPGAEPQSPPVAAPGIGRPPGPSPHGPQQPPQLWLRWGRPRPSQTLHPNPRAAAQPSPSPAPRAPTDSRDLPRQPTHQGLQRAPWNCFGPVNPAHVWPQAGLQAESVCPGVCARRSAHAQGQHPTRERASEGRGLLKVTEQKSVLSIQCHHLWATGTLSLLGPSSD